MDKKEQKEIAVEVTETKVKAPAKSTKKVAETGVVVAVCKNFLLVKKADGSAIKVYGKEANDGDIIEI